MVFKVTAFLKSNISKISKMVHHMDKVAIEHIIGNHRWQIDACQFV